MINRQLFPSTQTPALDAPSMEAPKNVYEPIDCDFTDELEHVSVLKIPVEIEYWNADGSRAKTYGLIKTIETVAKEEYLIVSTGVRIRLDHLYRLQIK